MRGKVKPLPQLSQVQRITPAYAGKSRPVEVWNMLNQDHPRLCGEKWPAWLTSLQELGSPPPMRGKDKQFRFPNGSRRITPAYAGKRSDAII